MSTVAGQIARILQAYRTCRDRAQGPLGGDAERWANRHNGALSDICSNHLPSGAGIESCELVTELSDESKLTFDVDFHCMNDGGYYIGHVHYRVVVTPAFDDINLDITLTDSTDDDAEDHAEVTSLADDICETLHTALTASMEKVPREYYCDM